MSDANTAINTVSVDCPAKTNLTLHVGRPRSEWGGRHELDTIYCAVGVYDTVTTSRKKPGSGFSLNLEGAYLGDLASSGSDMRRNHAVLALFAMAEASGHEPDVALNIEKRIPVGAGMAGGSADAAASSDDGRCRGGTVTFLVGNDALAVSSRVERPTIALVVPDPRLIEVFRVLLHELYGHACPFV